MFGTILVCFFILGMVFNMFDTLFPIPLIPLVVLGFRWTGLCLIGVGSFLYMARAIMTGANEFIKIPNPNRVKIIDVGESGAKILDAKKDVLNHLKRKDRLWSDMGGGTTIAGHQVQLSVQTINYTTPIWLVDLIQRYKEKYGVRNKENLYKLYENLRNVEKHTDLFNIPELDPVLKDPEKRKELLSMSIDDIRRMSELCYDGKIRDMTTFKDFDETVSAYDTESYVKRILAHRSEQRASYRYVGGVDWTKVVIPLAIILIVGAIAFQIFKGGI